MGATNCKERSPVSNPDEDDYVEGVVCQESDLDDNQMKEVSLVGDHKVLLVKQGGTITAIGTKCSHYGAPLAKGALGDGRVRCPWHGACFNIKNGDIEDFPGLDSIPCYEVKIESGGQVRVKARRGDLAANKRVKGMARRDPQNNKTAVVVGGGGAGASCVEALRQEGFTGRVILICREAHLPYDRPKLTKAMEQTPEKLALRNADFYKSFDIEVMVGVEVTKVDPSTKSLTLSKGDQITYDALFLATGSDPRQVQETPGSDLKNIMVLRTVSQANQIAAEAKAKRLVILGNSFIGMEVAATMSDKASSVTVVGRSQAPFEAVLGREVGARLGQMFTEAGVTVFGGRSLSRFVPSEDDSGTLGGVELDDGTKLPADICVLGLGTVPATEFLKESGIKLEQRSGTITVDKGLKSSVDGIWAGGDIAATPLSLGDGSEVDGVAIGHWQVAHYHGKIAAANMVSALKGDEQTKQISTVPFFWTMIFGKSVRYAGYGAGFDEVKIVGDLSDLKFVAYYLKNGHVRAVATMNRDPLAAQFAERLAAKRPPLTRQDIEEAKEDLFLL